LQRKQSLTRGVFVGALAGLLGCVVMAGFQEAVARNAETADELNQGPHAPDASEENTTETAARRAARQFGHTLSRQEKQAAGRWLHYGFGTLMGAAYGATAEVFPMVGAGLGTVFGSVLFLATDEAALPLLDLASQPGDTKPAEHFLHWASHVAYSMSMEVTRRVLVSRV